MAVVIMFVGVVMVLGFMFIGILMALVTVALCAV